MDEPSRPLPTRRRVSRPARGLQSLCAQLPDAALLWLGRRLGHVNARARTLLGSRTGALSTRTLHSLLAVLPRTGSVVESGHATVLCADGGLRTLRVSVVPLQRLGHLAQIWLLNDVSEVREEREERARLKRSHDQLARLSAAIDAVQQGRRRDAAQRVHDELLQPLGAIRMNLASQARAAGGSLPVGPAAVLASIDIAQTAIESGRDIVRSLGSPMLVELGLAAALEALAGDFARRQRTPCGVRFRGATGQGEPASAAAVHCLYRVAEEALANIAQHARARRVYVRLAGDRSGGLSLRIGDDGVGMQAPDPDDPQAIGLQVLEQRVQALGGRLVVRSAPGAGTTVTARLPAAGQPAAGLDPRRETLEAALTRLFYRVPVGLVQADVDGHIELMNPRAAGWLLPISPDGRLDNLFSVLSSATPQLVVQARSLQRPDGVLCGALPCRGERSPPVGLTLTKQAGTCWIAVLAEPPLTTPALVAVASGRGHATRD